MLFVFYFGGFRIAVPWSVYEGVYPRNFLRIAVICKIEYKTAKK